MPGARPFAPSVQFGIQSYPGNFVCTVLSYRLLWGSWSDLVPILADSAGVIHIMCQRWPIWCLMYEQVPAPK